MGDLEICHVFMDSIVSNRPLVHFSGSGGLGVTKLVTFCGCHICMTPIPELINSYVNFWSEICQTKMYKNIWHEVFKNGPSMLQRTISLHFFKGCLPQNLLGTFLNTFPHIWMENIWKTSVFESLD